MEMEEVVRRWQPEAVLLGASASWAADAGLDQDAAHRGTAQVDALTFPQQLGGRLQSQETLGVTRSMTES